MSQLDCQSTCTFLNRETKRAYLTIKKTQYKLVKNLTILKKRTLDQKIKKVKKNKLLNLKEVGLYFKRCYIFFPHACNFV